MTRRRPKTAMLSNAVTSQTLFSSLVSGTLYREIARVSATIIHFQIMIRLLQISRKKNSQI